MENLSTAVTLRCNWRRVYPLALLIASGFQGKGHALGQCAGIASSLEKAAECAAHEMPMTTVTTIDPSRPYGLAELIDLAEQNNPQTRIAWERAKQKADDLGVAKSAYFPVLAGVAAFGDQRIINPFPKPLAPRGYVLAEIPSVVPEVSLDYLLFDFGKRGARVDSATAEKLAAGANFIQTNQQVAFRVASSYYKLITQQERLEAARQTLKTAQTTQDAAEAQLANGRSTLPDVLNARAETAQAVFDMESADGDEKIARVTLTQTLGIEPSPNITIDAARDAPLPESLTLSVDELIDRAMKNRPDLAAQALEIRRADDAAKAARSEYWPEAVLRGKAAYTSVWPTADFGQLGAASQATWAATLGIQWRLFDGGARKNELAKSRSERRSAQEELREKEDDVTREVWTAYISFRTALRKERAARALLESASASYSSSLDAYRYGVKNLIDVVTAEKQLATARYSNVSARSELFLDAVDLEFVTGNLLRTQPKATRTGAGAGPISNPTWDGKTQ